jgi:hypothetical protein
MNPNGPRRGVSTILGTIIFIGILFTSVIPMLLVMKQADTIYEQNILEAERKDDEHSREEIYVYVYPTGESAPDNLTVKVKNGCEMVVEIIRIWVNDEIHSLDEPIMAMTERVLGSFDVGPIEGTTYDIMVTTKRGNVFESETGPISYEEGIWTVEIKMINVLISSTGTVFKIYVTLPNEQPHPSSPATVWKLGGSAFKSFDITSNGNGDYNVQVKKGSKVIHNENVTMNWPNGPAVLWVHT